MCLKVGKLHRKIVSREGEDRSVVLYGPSVTLTWIGGEHMLVTAFHLMTVVPRLQEGVGNV